MPTTMTRRDFIMPLAAARSTFSFKRLFTAGTTLLMPRRDLQSVVTTAMPLERK